MNGRQIAGREFISQGDGAGGDRRSWLTADTLHPILPPMKDHPGTLVSKFRLRTCAAVSLLALSGGSLAAQPVAPSASSPAATPPPSEAVVTLNPFLVEGTEDVGYMATSTLAGTRLRTNLRDIGTAVSVLTPEFLGDIGATDNQSALAYATGMEVGGLTGNFQNAPNTGSWGQTAESGQHFSPNTNTRVRGLVSADNTRNYFRTNVAWDGYNVSRIDLLRGPNSILFGLGSPGGVINATTETANLRKDAGQVQFTFDENGTTRITANYNKVIVPGQLAVRVAGLADREDFQQKPAYDDEDRLFGSATYRPEFLNRNGTTFDLTVDYETGDGESNRARTAPPLDWMTAWVQPVSTNPIQLPAGTNFRGFANGVIPAFTQSINQAGLTFDQIVGRQLPTGIAQWFDAFGTRLHVNSNVGDDFWRPGRVFVHGVLNPNGTVYTGNPNAGRRLYGYGSSYADMPIQAFNAFLVGQGHPFGNAFIPPQITDPSVYNFYDNLLDGPNKREWNDFDQLRIVLANTFMNQKFGYELSFFEESVTRGQTTFLSDAARIFVDTALEDIEGNPNPDFGRPYVQETTFGANRIQESEIEGFRASAYFDHDFRNGGDRTGWFRKLLGRHVFNAAYSEDQTDTDVRNFQRHVYGDDMLALAGPTQNLFSNPNRVSLRYYIGDSLLGRTSVAGANIGNLDRYVIPEGGTIQMRYFDTTWNGSVAPNAPWVNPLGQTWEQAANPANYVGWRTGEFTLIDALSGNQADFERATRAATLSRNEVDSKVLSWQGYLFNGAVVGTYGWREDRSNSARYDSVSLPNPYNSANLAPSVYTLSNPGTARDSLTVQSRNFSVVAHLNEFKFIGDKLPINVSISYNEGENFNPTSGRRDVNGNFLAPPQGRTEEYGVLLSTKDNRYSLRIMKYETGVLNSSSVQIPNANFRFNQFLTLNPREMINDIESGDLRADYEALATQPGWSIDAQETIHGPAWRQFEQAFAAAFPGFVDSWLDTGTWSPMNRDSSFSTRFVTTEDNVSEGYEIELTANPTRALRLTLNVSQSEAVRTNVPGPSVAAVYQFIQNAMVNPDGTPTAAGAMRSGYDWLNATMADFWTLENWIPYGVVQQLNGQPAPELVEWRANMLANYTFNDGALKGFGVGGALRWESSSTIGFPYYFDDNGTPVADIDNGFKRDSNERIDLWLRYRRPIMNGKVDWSIQLNVTNAFNDDELIPVRANPDGTFANFRIQQGRTWRISNTFSF